MSKFLIFYKKVIGIKSNFSQPFFIHWHVLCGTRMTPEEIEAKKAARAARAKQIAEAKLVSKTIDVNAALQKDGETTAGDESDSGVEVDEKQKIKDE